MLRHEFFPKPLMDPSSFIAGDHPKKMAGHASGVVELAEDWAGRIMETWLQVPEAIGVRGPGRETAGRASLPWGQGWTMRGLSRTVRERDIRCVFCGRSGCGSGGFG